MFIYYINMYSTLQKCFAEFIGTCFFLSVIIFVGHPILIGAALTTAIYLGGKISGGHFNPAVTVMMVATKKIPLANGLPYIIAQIAGALVAVQLYRSFGHHKPFQHELFHLHH